jgi:hypothetical protein
MKSENNQNCLSCLLISSVALAGSAAFTARKALKATSKVEKIYWTTFSGGMTILLGMNMWMKRVEKK